MATPSPAELQYQEEHINQTKAPGLIAATTIFGLLALSTLCLRIQQRTKKGSAGLGLDDWLMVGAGIFAFALTLSIYFTCAYGLGKHAIAVTNVSHLVMFLKWILVLGFCYPIAMTLAKLSILALVARVFGMRRRSIRWGVWIIAVYSVLWCLAVYLVIGLSCQPFSTNWSLTSPCNPGRTATIYTGAFNTLSDVAVILLPQPSIWKLHMSFAKKIAVTALLTAGLFATVCAIVRMVLTYQLSSVDVTYALADVGLFFVLEVLVFIACGNLPTIHQVLTSTFYSASGFLSISSFRSRSQLSSGKDSSGGSTAANTRSKTSSWRKFGSIANSTQHSQGEESQDHVVVDDKGGDVFNARGDITKTTTVDIGVTDNSRLGSEEQIIQERHLIR